MNRGGLRVNMVFVEPAASSLRVLVKLGVDSFLAIDISTARIDSLLSFPPLVRIKIMANQKQSSSVARGRLGLPRSDMPLKFAKGMFVCSLL